MHLDETQLVLLTVAPIKNECIFNAFMLASVVLLAIALIKNESISITLDTFRPAT